MATPPLATPTPYIPQGVRKIYWLPSVANMSSPTRIEMNAGTDLTGAIPSDGVEGFTTSTDFVDVPNLGSKVVGKIGGKVTFADSSLTFYASSNSSDVRSVLTVDLSGYILILTEGDVATQKMDVYKVQVASQTKPTSEDPAKIQIGFGVFSATSNVTIPA